MIWINYQLISLKSPKSVQLPQPLPVEILKGHQQPNTPIYVQKNTSHYTTPHLLGFLGGFMHI